MSIDRNTNLAVCPVRSGRTRRRVLMIAAAFPPTGGPGVQRSVKFAKYLPRFGWTPTVWATEPFETLPRDPTLLDDLPPDIAVHRRRATGSTHVLRRSSRAVERCLRNMLDGRRRVRSRKTASPSQSGLPLVGALEWRLRRWSQRCRWPDDCANWAKSSVVSLRRLIQEDRIDAIYSTFSPASNHLLGLRLKRLTGLPWLADFRDLWTDDYRYREPSPKRRAADARCQLQILDRADAVVAVTPMQTHILSQHVPQQRHKFHTITNGFDPDDFPLDETSRPHGRAQFVLTHVGRLDRWCATPVWFTALKQLASRLGANRASFLLRVVGHADESSRAKLRASGVPFTFLPYVPHAQAVKEMRSADGLLLIVPDGPNATSVHRAKLFEYLAAQRPIVVVGPDDNEAERIVRRCEAGTTVGFEPSAIAGALFGLFQRWLAGNPVTGCDTDQLEPYSRVTLTRRLASLLDQLVDSRRGPVRPQSVSGLQNSLAAAAAAMKVTVP